MEITFFCYCIFSSYENIILVLDFYLHVDVLIDHVNLVP
jgi:hypothetical protein